MASPSVHLSPVRGDVDLWSIVRSQVIVTLVLAVHRDEKDVTFLNIVLGDEDSIGTFSVAVPFGLLGIRWVFLVASLQKRIRVMI